VLLKGYFFLLVPIYTKHINVSLLATCFTSVSCLACSSVLKMEATCRLTFNRLHGIISQKTEFFITTSVRTCNPTYKMSVTFYTISHNVQFIYILPFSTSQNKQITTLAQTQQSSITCKTSSLHILLKRSYGIISF
jgi:hypothetical protein